MSGAYGQDLAKPVWGPGSRPFRPFASDMDAEFKRMGFSLSPSQHEASTKSQHLTRRALMKKQPTGRGNHETDDLSLAYAEGYKKAMREVSENRPVSDFHNVGRPSDHPPTSGEEPHVESYMIRTVTGRSPAGQKMFETHERYENSSKGTSHATVTRGMGKYAHKAIKSVTKNGDIETTHVVKNLHDSELRAFDKEWKEQAKALPRRPEAHEAAKKEWRTLGKNETRNGSGSESWKTLASNLNTAKGIAKARDEEEAFISGFLVSSSREKKADGLSRRYGEGTSALGSSSDKGWNKEDDGDMNSILLASTRPW